MRMRATPLPLAIALSVALSAGCTTGAPSRELADTTLVVRTGGSCAEGCRLDRPLLVGAEVVADVLSVEPLEGLEARTLDGSIASAWVEPVRLCCGRGEGASCRVMETGESACGGEQSQRRRVVIRAHRVGRTAIELVRDGAEGIETVAVAVEDAVEVSAIPTIVPRELADVVGGPIGEPWIDRRIERLELRVGEVALLRMVALAPRGRDLIVDEAAGAAIADPEIARVGPMAGLCTGAVAQGPHLELEAVAPGTTVVTLHAGSAQGAFEVVVSGACDALGHVEASDVACESDADCAPAGCCHPTACTAAAQAPSCAGVACTLECRAGTLDCGGRCLCLEGRCAAYIPALPDPGCSVEDDDDAPFLDGPIPDAGPPGPF